MAESILFELGITGDDQVSRALGNVEERLRKLESAERSAGRAVEDTNKKLGETGAQAGTAGVKLSSFGSTLGMAGQAVGRFSQQGGQMVSVLGGAAGSITSMTMMLGPMGLALGLAQTAFSLVAVAAGNASNKLTEATTAARATTTAFLEMVDGITAAETAYSRMSAILGGTGSARDTAAAMSGMRARLAAAERVIARGAAGDGAGLLAAIEERDALRGQIGQIERNAGSGNTDAQGLPTDMGSGTTGRPSGFGGPTTQPPRPPRGSGGGGGRSRRIDRLTGFRGARSDMDGGALGTSAGFTADRTRNTGTDRGFADAVSYSSGVGGEAAGEFEALDRLSSSLEANASSAAETFRSAWTSSVDDVIGAWDRANTAARQAGEEQLTTGDLMAESAKAAGMAVVTYVGEQATGALRQSVAAWLDGSKSFGEAASMMAKSVVQALVAESIVMTVVEAARGVTALASVVTAPLAPGHFAAAAAWAAVGTVAGTVGLATGAVGSPAGGAPASAGTQPTADTGPSGDSGGGGRTYVINLPSGVVLGDRAQAGRMLREAIRESEQRYG